MCRATLSILLTALLLGFDEAAPLGAGSRSILRAVSGDGNDGSVDYGVELNATNFDAVLKETPAGFSIVEFFAHWCPACRNYKPQYEKVARLFNGPDAVHPGTVLMTRVDCALKINNDLCDKFSVGHYPMLFWGPSSKFVGASWEPKQKKSEIHVIEHGRTAEDLLGWINKQLGSSYALDDEKFENEHLSSNISDPEQISQAVYDVEEATSTALDIILKHKMIKSETRASLIKFMQLLVAHHPSVRCRQGSAQVLVNFDELYPSDVLIEGQERNHDDGKSPFHDFQICGKEVPRGYWMFCRGSKNDTRGFSCGLWVLFHSLSVRVDDAESHFAFTAICDFIHNFFICEECRQHSYDMCSSVTTQIKTTRELVLWLWDTHNKVNERLMKEEESLGTGDLKFPKTVWPHRLLCSSCYSSHGRRGNRVSDVDWNKDEVYRFLTQYYGRTLVSLYKKEALLQIDGTSLENLVASTNAVVVPVGAALAIAIASCAFGALTCYWRSQQKNRKPRRSWN